jgi:hypothetical protein
MQYADHCATKQIAVVRVNLVAESGFPKGVVDPRGVNPRPWDRIP